MLFGSALQYEYTLTPEFGGNIVGCHEVCAQAICVPALNPGS